MVDVQIMPGTRDGSRIYHCGDGHHYHYNKQYCQNENAGEVYLRCRRYDSRACPGSVTVTVREDGSTEWINTHRHTCAPDMFFGQVRALKRAIIQEAIAPNNRHESPAELVQRVRAGFRVEVAARVNVAGMRTAIQKARGDLYPPVPVSLEGLGFQLQLHPHITETSDGQDNLFAGVVHGPTGTTSVVFVSRRMRRYMRRAKLVFADGTFGSRPNSPGSAQVLQILTVIRNAAIPLVQVLMEGKSEEEYQAVLEHLKNLVPQFRPSRVMTDYETALQNAWKTVFPNAYISGCYWHYCRAILKKVKELGLTAFTRQSRRHAGLMRAFCAIPLLPQPLIQRGFQTLLRVAHRLHATLQLLEFLNYFIDTWLRAPFFTKLSVFGLKHRTNNVAESCNKLLRTKTGAAHQPSLWEFLAGLQKYETYSYINTRTAEMGLDLNRARKVSAVNNDRCIKNFTTDLLDGRISINKFLHRSSHQVQNVYDRFVV